MRKHDEMLSLAELKARLRRFCEKHRIQRLDVFGSAARGEAGPGSDVDLLVTLNESSHVSTGELLEMAGEAEELLGAPVDFALRPSLERSRNHFAREHILYTASVSMEADQLGQLRDILEASRLIASYVKDTTETDFRPTRRNRMLLSGGSRSSVKPPPT